MLTTLSQGHLSLLETCPRKFQHIYIDQLGGPVDPNVQARQRWGSQFHLLMQQRELGLPIEALPSENSEFQACIQALAEAAPELFEPPSPRLRQSEHLRSLAFNDYLLTAVYDLLLLDHNAGKIIDWKTHLRPKATAQLTSDWQTRLYLFLLVETTALLPEQVSMDYWFVRCQDPETGKIAPQRVSISYGAGQHRQTREHLQHLTERLSQLLRRSDEFPKVASSKGICENCPFAYRCDRLTGLDRSSLPPLSAVAEVPLAPSP